VRKALACERFFELSIDIELRLVSIFPWIRGTDNASGQTGLLLGTTGAAAAQLMRARGTGKPRLVHCAYEAGERAHSLASVMKQLPSRKLPAVSILPSASYNLLLVEAPDVPGDELRAAVRWRIKDLIDFHVDDAVIDVFQMPALGRGGPNQMMYAIAAKAEFVRGQVDVLESAGLKLEVIDIPELALRNVAAALEHNSDGVALLHLADRYGILLLVRQGVMYLTRRIETGVRTLRDANGLRADLIAGLALEARRSLDYFESHYEQTPISTLYTTGLQPDDLDQLSQELGISVSHLEYELIVEMGVAVDEDTQRRCLAAVGAALRHDTVKL
jgi:MSHA biogenesis protein MshI